MTAWTTPAATSLPAWSRDKERIVVQIEATNRVHGENEICPEGNDLDEDGVEEAVGPGGVC